MLAKIIAHGPDRPTALRRLARALETSVLLGCVNNLGFLRQIVLHPAHIAGDLSTAFLEQHGAALGLGRDDLATALALESSHTIALVAATLLQWPQAGPTSHWRNSPNAPQRYRYRLSADTLEVQLTPPRRPGQPTSIQIEQTPALDISASSHTDHQLTLTVDGYRQSVVYARQGDDWWIAVRGTVVQLRSLSLVPEPQPSAAAAGGLRAPMPGAVSAVLVEVGQAVEAGTALIKLEAMKMEHTIRTAAAGVVTAIFCAPGDSVQADSVLVEMSDVAASSWLPNE
jgi:acetyl/propionyl-CoA carboxylase alpha subunit